MPPRCARVRSSPPPPPVRGIDVPLAHSTTEPDVAVGSPESARRSGNGARREAPPVPPPPTARDVRDERDAVRSPAPTPTPTPIEPRVEVPDSGLFADDPYAPSEPLAGPGVESIEPAAFVAPAPTREPDVPSMLDDAPLPLRYGVDECVALAVDPTTLYVYWEARPATIGRARRALEHGGDHVGNDGASRNPGATIAVSTLRVLVVEVGDCGPTVGTRDFELVDLELGEYFVRELPAGAVVRAAIGLRVGERFLPIAHTLDVEAPPARPWPTLARELVLWNEHGTHAPSAEIAGRLRPPPELPGLPARFVDDAEVEPLDPTTGLSSAELAARRARRPGEGPDARRGQGSSDRLGRPPSSGSWQRAR